MAPGARPIHSDIFVNYALSGYTILKGRMVVIAFTDVERGRAHTATACKPA